MEENGTAVFLLIIVMFPFAFSAIWLMVILIISILSGWQTLAGHYHYAHKFNGQLHRFQSARINGTNFSGSLEIGTNDEGLYLVPFILFRPFHKPLFIPWGEIQVEPTKILLFNAFELRFFAAPKIRVTLYERVYKNLEPFMDIK